MYTLVQILNRNHSTLATVVSHKIFEMTNLLLDKSGLISDQIDLHFVTFLILLIKLTLLISFVVPVDVVDCWLIAISKFDH